jgi:hypothetical protein
MSMLRYFVVSSALLVITLFATHHPTSNIMVNVDHLPAVIEGGSVERLPSGDNIDVGTGALKSTALLTRGEQTRNRLNLPVCIITPFVTGGPLISNFDPVGTDSISGAACDITNYGTFFVTAGDNQGTRIDGIQAATHVLPRGTIRSFCNINGTADDGVIGWVINGATASAGNQVLTAWSSADTWTDTLATHTGDCQDFILQPQGAGPTNAWTPLSARVRQWRETIANLEIFPCTTPATITGTVNDWNPPDTAPQAAAPGTFGDYSCVNLGTVDGTGATLTGMQHGTGAGGTSGKGEGQIKCISNGGPGVITIPHHSGTSSPSNQFTNPGSIAIQIQVNTFDCFFTFGAAWQLIGSGVSTSGVANNTLPKMLNLGLGDSTSNELVASATLDTGVVTTTGPLQVADSASATQASVGIAYFSIAPTGAGITTTRPAYNIENVDNRSFDTTGGAVTQFGIVSLQDATRSAGANTFGQVSIYSDANNCSSSTLCYSWESQHGNEYHNLGAKSGFYYYNTGYGDYEDSLKVEATLTLGGGDFNGTAKAQIAQASVTPTSVSHGTLSADASNFQGEVTTVGANTSVTLTFGGGGFGTTSHCFLTVEGSSTVGMQVSTVSNTAPVFSCFTFTTGQAANCPNFVYQCWGH